MFLRLALLERNPLNFRVELKPFQQILSKMPIVF